MLFYVLLFIGSGLSEPPSVGHKNGISSTTTLRLSKGVGRLKAVKIKSIVRKVSKEKEKTNEHRYEEPDMDELDDDDSDDDEYDDDDDDPIVSSAPQAVWIRNKNVSVKSGIEQLIDNKSSNKPFESKENLTFSKGWNGREPRRSDRGEIRDPKPTRKYDAGSDFFSRKSFRELGCGDDMIEALRAQDFVRPSHVQVHQFDCL